MKLRLCTLALVLAVGAIPGSAVIVDHDATDGIAAIFTYPSSHGDRPGIVVLGTDGHIYELDKKGELSVYDFPQDLELQWPVDFEEISEWTPLWYELPSLADYDYIVHPGGLIRCRDGSRWFSRVLQTGGWETTATGYELEWRKLPSLR